MKIKYFLFLATFSLSFICCGNNSRESSMEYFYHYDTSLNYNEELFILDSISKCIFDFGELDLFEKKDSLFVEDCNSKKIIVFPSQMYSFAENIKSIGVYSMGDTLKIELIEKEKTPNYSLDCPVWVYGTLNGNVAAKYIKTRSGIYPLKKK